MTWFAVGAAAVSVVGSAYGQQQSKKKIEAQARDENNRRSAANLSNAVRAGYRQGLLNLQEAQYKKAAVQQGFDLSRSGLTALSEVNANNAAAGAVGASVDIVAQDVEMKVGEAKARREEVEAIQDFNFDLQSRELQYGLEAGFVDPIKADVPSDDKIWSNAAVAGGTTFLNVWGGQRMRLGPTGSAPTSTTA